MLVSDEDALIFHLKHYESVDKSESDHIKYKHIGFKYCTDCETFKGFPITSEKSVLYMEEEYLPMNSRYSYWFVGIGGFQDFEKNTAITNVHEKHYEVFWEYLNNIEYITDEHWSILNSDKWKSEYVDN